jgi:hypothetical protein
MRALLSWEAFDAEHGWRAETTVTPDSRRVTMLLGPEQPAPAPFTEAIASWSATTPAGSWIEVQLRVRRAGHWTSFYRIAQWDSRCEGSLRRSFDAQPDDDGHVATDTLVLIGTADMIQPRLLLYTAGDEQPALRALRIALSAPAARARPAAQRDFAVRELPIPLRSQMDYPNGDIICSPTVVTMLLAYWHARTGAERLAPFAEQRAVSDLVAPRVYDPVYEGHGNWSFSTAFAASCGLDAYVARLGGLDEIEPWIAVDVPVAISLTWQAGELTNAPIRSSAGHLLIVSGFDGHGGVIVADPRGERVDEVRRIYDVAQLEAAWQHGSAGVVYLIHPYGWPAPSRGAPWC